jgi:two-component system response regulator AtoC
VSQDATTDISEVDAGARSYTLCLVNDSGPLIVPLPASGSVVIGRGVDSDVRVVDTRMSRQHARIHVGTSFFIEDLYSTNGTFVDGRRLSPGEQRAFQPGDGITLGATTALIYSRTRHVALRLASGPTVEPIASDIMKPVLAIADRTAASMVSVLLLGETGVGKDVLAERIHRASLRAGGPFLRLNCAAFSPALLASELFGHEKGAFTGANSARPGLLQSARGGTVFLDEVGDLPVELQAKLLLVLERREVLPVGAVVPRQLDVRFISATNRNLPRDIEAGVFRRDLYYRLNGITIEVPPLRERLAEIEPLAQLFVREAARSIGRAAPTLSSEVLDMLRVHPWPGNIRELRAVMERAVLLGADDVVRVQDIVLASPPTLDTPAAPVLARAITADDDDSAAERQHIVEMLAQCGGNQSRAAKRLGMSRNTLIARIEKYGLARPLSPRGRP